jgi:hypothetical protein
MKKFYLFLLFSLMCVNNLKAQVSNAQLADITKFLTFKNDNYDMGKISNGKPIEFTVDVLNISNSNITLDNVIVGCGCTTPKYIKGQVLTPGSHAIVTLGFNGAAIGPFSKSATFFFSGNLVKSISFHGVGVE